MRQVIEGQECVSRSDAKTMLGVARETVTRLREAGTLPGIKDATGNYWYPVTAVEALAARRRAGEALPGAAPQIGRTRRAPAVPEDFAPESTFAPVEGFDNDDADEERSSPVVDVPPPPRHALAGRASWTDAMRKLNSSRRASRVRRALAHFFAVKSGGFSR